MTSKPVLVDLEKLREIVSGLDLGDRKRNEFIEARWLKYVEWWDARAAEAKGRFLWMQSAVVTASAIVPAMIALRELAAFHQTTGWVFSVGAIVASFAVAMFAGLERLYGYGDIWREKRNAAEVIKSEGFCFFNLCGPYTALATHQAAFQLFSENTEKIIRSEIHEYVSAIGSRSQAETIEPGKGRPEAG